MLKIEEPGPKTPKQTSFSTGKSTVTFTKIEMKTVLAYLLDKDEKLLEFNHLDRADMFVNINFASFSDTLNRKQIILESLQEVYHFKIHRENRLRKSFELEISDSLLLKKYLSVSLDSMPFTITRSLSDLRFS